MFKRFLGFLLFIQFSYSQAQEAWEYQNWYFYSYGILESYDGGALFLSTRSTHFSNPRVYKVSQSGELLWEHTFEDYGPSVIPSDFFEDEEGNITIIGRTSAFTPFFPLIESGSFNFTLKLNPCGEPIHMKVVGDGINEVPTENELYYILQSTVYNEGIYSISKDFETPYGNNAHLIKINSTGDFEWEKKYFVDNDTIIPIIPRNIIRLRDGGFLITYDAWCDMYQESSPADGFPRIMNIKLDSLGNQLWYDVYRWEDDSLDSPVVSMNAHVNELANENLIVVGHNNELDSSMTIYELNPEGEMLWQKDLYPQLGDSLYFIDSKSCIVNDSLIIIASKTQGQNLWNSPVFIEVGKFDLEGNLLGVYNDTTWVGGNDQMNIALSKDSANLYVTPGITQTENAGVYLRAFKLNLATMELDTFIVNDTINYDYFCPEGVVSQDIYVPHDYSTTEIDHVTHKLIVSPNPAVEYINIDYNVSNFNNSVEVVIYDLYGNLKSCYYQNDEQGLIQENVKDFSSGTYMAAIIVDGRLVESQKFIVQ